MIYFLLLWHILGMIVNQVVIQNDFIVPNKKFNSTVVAFFHSFLVTYFSFVFVIFDLHQYSPTLYWVSMSYFLRDLFNCYQDKIMVGHHVGTIVLMSATIYVDNGNYFFYTNLLLFLGEVTAICQHHFFLNKMAYGKENEVEFVNEYYGLFVVFFSCFSMFRIVFMPMLVIRFLAQVEELWYFFTFLTIFTALILGSMYWIMGQTRLLNRMDQIRFSS